MTPAGDACVDPTSNSKTHSANSQAAGAHGQTAAMLAALKNLQGLLTLRATDIV
jgi:hypothetical protein